MDRLTATIKLPPEGVFISCTEEQLEEIRRADNVSPREIYRQLQAYEDTGLTPEEITAMKSDNERLHKLVDTVQTLLWGDTEKKER
ncbi:MAG: hypothetical protein K2O14_03590 [Oscillospiraceae bacterium]|nr:hypothetical protein [Oscillospiraceae bacterium]